MCVSIGDGLFADIKVQKAAVTSPDTTKLGYILELFTWTPPLSTWTFMLHAFSENTCKNVSNIREITRRELNS